MIVVALAERVEPLTSREDPSLRGRYEHCRVTVLIRRLMGTLDTFHEAVYSVKGHAYRLLAPIEVHGAKGRSVEQRHSLIISIAIHLLFVLDVCSWDRLPVSNKALVHCATLQKSTYRSPIL